MEQLERQTYLMKLMLVLMRDRKARQAQVRNVGYLREYGELSENLGVHTLGQMPEDELIALANQVGIKKRPATGKSDIYMNDLGYILVANNDKLPLIEGVSQQQLAQLAEGLQLQSVLKQLSQLSKLAQLAEFSEFIETNQHAESSQLAESMQEAESSQLAESMQEAESSQMAKLSQLAGESDICRKEWMELIARWWCQGSIEEPSRFPAELILCYNDPLNMNTWDIYDPEQYLEMIWEQLSIVIESDGSITINKY